MQLIQMSTKSAGGRRQDPNYKQLNLLLSPEMIKKLKVKAVERELNISELSEIIFTEWLDKNE
jgi:hypothetical protein